MKWGRGQWLKKILKPLSNSRVITKSINDDAWLAKHEMLGSKSLVC
jgi:hypothetical protein